MLKTWTAAALMAVTVCAMAQNYIGTNGSNSEHGIMVDQDLRMQVLQRSDILRPADEVYMESFLDRLPSNQERVVVKALANTRAAAWDIRDQMAYAPSTVTTTTTDTTGSGTPNEDQTKPQVTNSNTWTVTEETMAPMRLVVQRPEPRDVSWQEARDILISGLDTSERAMFSDLWFNAPEEAKDAMTRYVMNSASWADMPIYRHAWMYHPGM